MRVVARRETRVRATRRQWRCGCTVAWRAPALVAPAPGVLTAPATHNVAAGFGASVPILRRAQRCSSGYSIVPGLRLSLVLCASMVVWTCSACARRQAIRVVGGLTALRILCVGARALLVPLACILVMPPPSARRARVSPSQCVRMPIMARTSVAARHALSSRTGFSARRQRGALPAHVVPRAHTHAHRTT